MSFVLQAAGMGASYKASKMQAKAAAAQGQAMLVSGMAEAKQLETRARQGVAVGTYNADIINRRAQEILASQRAAAAANGGDTTDATVQAITDETIRNASMEQLLTMAESEDKARQDVYAAKVARYRGAAGLDSARKESSAIKLGGYATLLDNTSKMIESASWQSTFGG